MSTGKNTAEVAARLRAAREARGFTLKQVSEASNYAVTTISGVENAQHEPSVRYLKDMILALGLNQHWLFVGSGEMFDAAAPGTSAALIVQAVAEIRAGNLALKEDLELAAGRIHNIELWLEDLQRLVKGEIRVAGDPSPATGGGAPKGKDAPRQKAAKQGKSKPTDKRTDGSP